MESMAAHNFSSACPEWAQIGTELSDGDADQADRPPRLPGTFQQTGGDPVDLAVLVGRLVQGGLPSDRGEIGPTELQTDGRSGQPRLPQARTDRIGQLLQRPPQGRTVGDIPG